MLESYHNVIRRKGQNKNMNRFTHCAMQTLPYHNGMCGRHWGDWLCWMLLCTLARNHLKMTRFSSMGWNGNDLNVCFRAEKTSEQSSVQHGTGTLHSLWKTVQNLSASESEFIHHRTQNGRKKLNSIMVSCVNKNQLACFIAQSGLCSSNCKNTQEKR